MKKRILLAFVTFIILSNTAFAQMWNSKDTLYGNEWINFSQQYYKISLTEDGIYRIPQATLSKIAAFNAVEGKQLQLFYLGQEIPLYVTNNNKLTNIDYVEFYGQKNRGLIDKFLYYKADTQQINREYSMFTDTSAYFLTWSSSGGKRYIESKTNLTNLPPREPFYIHEQKTVFNGLTIYNEWDKDNQSIGGDRVARSQFDTAEGFADAYSKDKTYILPADNIAQNGPDASCSVRYGTGSGSHKISLNLEGVTKDEIPTINFNVKNPTLLLPNAKILTSNKLQIVTKGNNESKFRVSTISFNYPRYFNFNNKANFGFNVNVGNAKYLKISNFKTNNKTAILYDYANGERIESALDSGFVKLSLPSSNAARQCILINPDSVRTVSDLTKVDFIDYKKSDANFLILSNKRLFSDPAAGGKNWVQAYADYRKSYEGGSYSTSVIEIQQLYDQFAYGINRHVICTRNFASYLAKTATVKPEYLLILGKGIEYRELRTTAAFQFRNERNFVPTYGYPASDNLLTASNTKQFGLVTGRIPALVPNDIRIYLDKLKEYELNNNLPRTTDDRLWMKRIVHVAGTDQEGLNIVQYLKQMEAIITKNQFGGEVSSFFKTSIDPVQTSNSQKLKDLLDNGCAIVTYFGHSSSTTFDYSIDEAVGWKRSKRYPLMIGLGCFTGNIHTYNRSISERFVMEKDKGAIAFMAPSSYGLDNTLALICNNFYFRLGGSNYGQSMAKVLAESLNSFGTLPGLINGSQSNQFTFQGDPAVKMYQNATPDYAFDPKSFSIEPSVLNTQLDSFKLKINMANIGRATKDTVNFTLTQVLPDGKKIRHISRNITAPLNTDSYTFSIPKVGEIAAGTNRFLLKIDANNRIKELPDPAAEINNDLNNGQGFTTYILANDAQPVSPTRYSIVNETPFVLRASTSNAFAPAQKYILQIDTTRAYNSPVLVQKSITQKGGLLEWSPDVLLRDSTVYYWRITADSSKTQKYNWNASSFVYIKKNPLGWNQSHYYQLSDNQLLNTVWVDKKTEYIPSPVGIQIQNGIYIDNAFRPQMGVNGYPNPSAPYYDAMDNQGFLVAMIDSISGYAQENIPSKVYGNTAGPTWRNVLSFATRTKAERATFIAFLDNIVPNKNYIALMSIQDISKNYRPQEWAADSTKAGDKNLFNVFEKNGAKAIRRTLKEGAKPYYFIYRKNDASFPTQERLADSLTQVVNDLHNIPGRWNSGAITSTLIGPAKSWEKLIWKFSNKEKQDLVNLEVIGVKKDLTSETILINKKNSQDTSLSGIDANLYPYLKLRFVTSDSLKRTAPQLDFWRVHYKGVTEMALDPSVFFEFKRDTLQQGDNMRIALSVKNISDIKTDSVLVKYSIKDDKNNEIVQYKRYKALNTADTLHTQLTLDTRNLSGRQQITVFANPNNDQAEQTTFNNIGIQGFFVQKDLRNPLLDVTFDGQHILNGEIVSSKPTIQIALRDENKYLLLNDTASFTILLRGPKDSVAHVVPISSPAIRFFPATSAKDNSARIEFSPTLPKDGVYSLLVRARDASDNHTTNLILNDIQQDPVYKDKYNYKIDFQVINKTTISNVLNYPNPFSTRTQFVYTLTGNVAPERFKIQIMTVSGQVVRELSQDELGPLRVGTHRTEYAWNGTDEFGDRLANGVYLYRIIAQKADGTDYEKYDNGTDTYFKNGFGKMVILR